MNNSANNNGLSLIKEYFEEHGIHSTAVYVNGELAQLRTVLSSDPALAASFIAIDNSNGFRMCVEDLISGISYQKRAITLEICNIINKNPDLLYFRAFFDDTGSVGLSCDAPSVPDTLVGEFAHELLRRGKEMTEITYLLFQNFLLDEDEKLARNQYSA